MRDESERMRLDAFLEVARANLGEELTRHRLRPFPPDAGTGFGDGSLEPTAVDADLSRYVSLVARGRALVLDDLTSVRSLRDALLRSLDRLPSGARAYFDDLAQVATHAHLIDWLRQAGQRFAGLEGLSIIGWSGVEMAIREVGAEGLPQFGGADLPFRQLAALDIEHSAGRCRVASSQQDALFGLDVQPASREDGPWEGIYRSAPGLGAPVGVVDRVVVILEEGVIADVALTVSGRTVLLMAGEVEEGPGGRLTFCRFDESVLVFPDAAAVEASVWAPPRPRTRERTGGG